jgi:hypothetical protein
MPPFYPPSVRRSGRLDLRGEAVEVGHRGVVVPDLDLLEQLGVPLGLARLHDDPDRHSGRAELPVPGHDRTVLVDVEVELEHDPVGLLEEGAALAAEERAERAGRRPAALDDPMAHALEDRAVEVAPSCGGIEEDHAAALLECHHAPPCTYLLASPCARSDRFARAEGHPEEILGISSPGVSIAGDAVRGQDEGPARRQPAARGEPR